ncbi:hypothetical protein Afil01_28770 [Actinorhabdospora filicis]|uniref:Uncharacterized protein n=1 Tax=Actinorhabdospora filicis TaxID=1785913 RepID=A0A9W6SJ84_9ACTN|nr:hypothetical protein [Actinorhabdospora filicis]GLZ78070.1 hypothetical protein Afil01_28770 [Actinorhabdospora filicis]
MTATLIPPVTPIPPAPRWAVRAAHLTVLCVLPASLWRIAMAIGIPVGFSAETLRADYHSPGWGTAYMIGLSLLGELAAFMTLGLVRDWGLVVPQWIPFIGGRPVRPMAAIVPAVIGAVVMTLLWGSQALLAFFVEGDGGLTGIHLAVMYACYAPLVLWGPLLGLVTWSYRRRTRQPGRGEGTARPPSPRIVH